MVYSYNEEIVNRSNAFFDEKNFVGYILPDGSIYKCVDHNVSNIETFFNMFLVILDEKYEEKDELLNIQTDDKLARIVLLKLKKMPHDEIAALRKFIDSNNIIISDLIVSLFGCHLITRLKKEIITSEIDHHIFYNYLLHDFKITTINKLKYDSEKKEYYYVKSNERNEYLYDEINKLKNEVSEDEIDLFYKSR